MLVKHSLSITVSRFSLFYKFLLFLSIVLITVAAISISSMYYIIKPIIQSVQNMQFIQHCIDAFRSIFTGSLEAQNAIFNILGQDFAKISEVFANNEQNVIGAACALVAFIFLGKFLISIGYYPLADVLNNFMNSNSKYGFTSNLIAHLKKSVAYGFFTTLFYIVYVAILGLIVYFIMWSVGKISVILAISLSVVVVMVLLALKRSVFAMWLPVYINEELGIFRSLQKAVITNKDLIVKNWGLFSAVNCVGFLITALLSIFLFALGTFFAISLMNLIFLSLELVIYYRRNERKYYIDAETIIDSKHSIKSVY